MGLFPQVTQTHESTHEFHIHTWSRGPKWISYAEAPVQHMSCLTLTFLFSKDLNRYTLAFQFQTALMLYMLFISLYYYIMGILL
jgi:hypothetical protein